MFKDSLGKPREGFHASRLPGDIATNDTLGTLGIASLISTVYDIPLWKTTVTLFVVGEVAHLSFGVETAVIQAIKKLVSSNRNGRSNDTL